MNIQELVTEIPVAGELSVEGIDFIVSGKQYLTFMLEQELYAVDILCVEEIRSWAKPTKIPNAPKDVVGVINMRGIIVPIIDLRLKFNIGHADYLATTVVIVLSIARSEGTQVIGFVVDAVADVLNAEDSEIKTVPALGGCVPAHYIAGLINVGDKVVTLVNTQALQVLEPH